ncbi:hypothetical protein GS429_11305 [Natronorubrum sp. JWXQ-INN-674]|uniref:Uncharacterized protein n=1 Tax=Natronorubrum halalkaliphilum TaxID=2691917 RepID=A0A6B0VLB6_9EURY|nr:hypothetical protein [Natronorubrum halalkaliphilum]MXV62641.1 hypothetical protein [Natronorubrum halalkaliphilum]
MLGSWSEHLEELLYEGERERRRVDLDAATVVVTNQRVIVFSTDGDAADYRHVDRPNVTRVSVETESAPRHLVWMTVLLFLGLGLLLLGSAIDLADRVTGAGPEGGDPTGVVDGLFETIQTILIAFELSIFAAGLLVLAAAAVIFGRYIGSRSRRLVLRVSGADDISVPVSDADLEADRPIDLVEAIGPTPPSEADGVTLAGDALTESKESG